MTTRNEEMFPEQDSLFTLKDRWQLDSIAEQATDEDVKAARELVRWSRA